MLHELAMGVPLSEVSKSLASKYRVKTATIYKDWSKRESWVQQVTRLDDPETFIAGLIDLLHWLKKRAALIILQSEHDSARIGAMRVIESIVGRLFDIAKATGKISIAADRIDVSVDHDITILLEQYEDAINRAVNRTFPEDNPREQVDSGKSPVATT